VPVLLILASVVILVGVVGVAVGRGGEMAQFAGDYPPFEADDLLTAADVALLRPPSALWGYNATVTDQALGRLAQVVTERDVEIAALRRQLAELRTGGTAGSAGTDSAAPTWSAEAAWSATAEPETAEPEIAEPETAWSAEAAVPAEADGPAEAAPADDTSADGGTNSGA
jgi:hypothetical protein